MSVTRIVSIHCDGCGVWHYGDDISVGGTAASIRRSLREQGWTVNVADIDGVRRDYCPNCRGDG